MSYHYSNCLFLLPCLEVCLGASLFLDNIYTFSRVKISQDFFVPQASEISFNAALRKLTVACKVVRYSDKLLNMASSSRSKCWAQPHTYICILASISVLTVATMWIRSSFSLWCCSAFLCGFVALFVCSTWLGKALPPQLSGPVGAYPKRSNANHNHPRS